MLEERPAREQSAELGPIVDKLIAMVKTEQEAFTHQRSQFLEDIINQLETLGREINSSMHRMNDLAAGKPGGEREPFLRLHSILTHLQSVAETIGRLDGTLRKQIKDGVLFSDKAISQTNHLFHQQEEILRYLADVIRNGGEGVRHRVIEACQNLGQSCLQFATDHETRLVEGLCFPQAAPLFLAILDHVQTIIHHELEVAHLLGNEF